MPIWNILIPLALSAAGGVASYAGQKKSADAQQRVLLNYRNRNKAREAEASAEFQRSLDKSGRDTADSEIAKGQDRRQAAYDAIRADTPGKPLPLAPTRDSLVRDTTVKNAGTAWSRLMDNAYSKLGGYQDWQLGQSIKNTRTNQALDLISSNARSDLNNVVPVEMAGAARKGDALQGWGSLLSAAGALSGMSAGLSAGGAPWSAVAKPAAKFNMAPESFMFGVPKG